MKISFTPVRSDDRLELSRVGDVLVINGQEFDFSPVPEGATLPRAAVACDWLASDVERVAGQLQLTLLLPHGANAPVETLFPVPVELGGDGPVAVPAYELAEPVLEEIAGEEAL